MSVVPRKIRQKVARLSGQLEKQTAYMLFTVENNHNYKALVAMGIKAIPALIEDSRDSFSTWGYYWRLELVIDIAQQYQLTKNHLYFCTFDYQHFHQKAKELGLYNYKQKPKRKADPHCVVYHSKEANVAYVITKVRQHKNRV